MNLPTLLSFRRLLAVAAVVGLAAGGIALAALYAGPALGLGGGVGPGRDTVGVITVPPFIITETSSRLIMRHLDYARRDDSIRAVVISLSSPGGGAAASEKLYLEVRNLREAKPVVIVMNGIAASGGYMMAMGGNYVYAQPSSLVGNVGVIVSGISTLPGLPSERTIATGPQKLSGADRQHWFDIINRLHSSFVNLVLDERGDRLRLTAAEVAEGHLYSGVEAVEYGLADAIGSDSAAIATAAELAGLSEYDVMDVNALVLREALNALRRAYGDDANLGSASGNGIIVNDGNRADSATATDQSDFADALPVPIPSLLTESAPNETPPGFPPGGQRPAFYYYYAGDGWQEPENGIDGTD